MKTQRVEKLMVGMEGLEKEILLDMIRFPREDNSISNMAEAGKLKTVYVNNF